MKVLDANIFLRFLTGDDPRKAERCRLLFKALEAGKERATTIEAVIAEVVYVLNSKASYGLPPDEIEARLRPLLLLRGLHLPGQRRYLRALSLYVDHPQVDFEDALLAAHMEAEGLVEIASYDRHLDRFTAIKRVEP